jgi:hypothetical protein
MATELTSNDLLLKLKSRFPSVKMGNVDGVTTVDPKEAVFFDFDFIVQGEKIASVSISIVDDNTLKLFYSNDILNNQDEVVKAKWFDFLKDMRLFAKKKLMNFDPSDITKKNLDKRDYEQMSAEARPNKTEEDKMNESALYGSTKSSYQKLENARLIIRHSQKVQEETANSRTRNIDSIYVENAQGERFRYPFNHLSGARAMMRHLANGGNPYDSFGQYIVGLSENVYNLRKFNNLMHRNAFLENSELTNIASAAKDKTISLKKVIERLQKQSGYEAIKENFTEYKRAELDDATLEALKNRFTIQQFNEELVDLFPYISDLIGEETVTEGGIAEIGKMLAGKNKMQEAPKKTASSKAAPANVKSTDEPTAADAAAEPIGKIPFMGRAGDDVGDLHMALKGMGEVRIEPFDKGSIQKAMDKVHAEIKDFEKAVADNPKDKKMQYGLEKAQARLGLLQARMGTASVEGGNPITKVGLFIDHLSKHVKDDKLSLILSRVADAYSEMSKQERQEVNSMISAMLKKAKYVPMFSAESTSFEELESMLGDTPISAPSHSTGVDPVDEYANLLDATIHEKSDILSTDLDVKSRALGELNQLMSDEFPVGTNGVNAIESLRGIIDDGNLFNQFKEMSQEDAAGDARQMIVAWVQQHAPDVMSELDVKGVDMPKVNKAPEEADDMSDPHEKEAEEVDKPINEVEDFVKSLYDRHTGNFPRGETGVLSSVEKKFGERAVPVAQSVIENLKQSFDENIMRMRKLAGVS